MLFATLDVEILDDPDFVRLEMMDSAWPWWFLRLVQFAKRANRNGLILVGSRAASAEDLCIAHFRSVSEADQWEAFLRYCVDLGLLAEDVEGFRILDWKRWHRRPSEEPERMRERKQRSREAQDSAEVVTSRDGEKSRMSHHRAEQSRAEQSRAEQQHQHGVTRADAEEVLSGSLADLRAGLGIVGRMKSRDLELAMAWGAEPLTTGQAIPEDIGQAGRYALEATLHQLDQGQDIKSRWKYAMTIAAEVLGRIVERRKLAEDQAMLGLPAPKPITFRPPRGALDADRVIAAGRTGQNGRPGASGGP